MKVWRSPSALMACTAMAMLYAAAPAAAQESSAQEPTVLQTITVKGKKQKAGAATDSPLTTTVNATAIEDKQVTSIEDLGRSLEPGVNFNRNTGAINIRGLEGSRVLTTIDGIPVPYLYDVTRGASGGVDAFDFSSLSAVDVMRGADSSRAGAGALGGVLGLSTLEPEDLISNGRDWGGVLKSTYDSSDDSIAGSVAVAKRFGGTSVLFQGGYKQGNERENNGTVEAYGPLRTLPNPSDYDQHNLLFKLRQTLEGGHVLGLTAERFRKDRDTDARTNQSLTGNYRPGNYDTHEDSARDRISLDYSYDGSAGVLDGAVGSLYWMKQVRNNGYAGIRTTTDPLGFISRDNEMDEETFGFIGSGSRSFDTGGFNHLVSAGIDIASSTSVQYSSGVDNCPPFYGPFHQCNFLHTNQADTPKVDSKRFGFFIDDEISMGDSPFYVMPGIRFDWLEHSPKMTPEFADNATGPALPPGFSDAGVSPKLRLGYRPHDKLEFFGQWAMAFRAPTAGELYSSYGGPGTYVRIGNPDLETETSNGFEIGAKLGDQNFGGRVNLFYNKYKNFIEARSLTADEALALGYDPANYPFGITGSMNIPNARIYGAEASVHKRFDNGFSVRAGLAYARGDNTDTGEFLPSVAPFKGVIGLAYDTETWGVGVDFIGAAKARGTTITSGTSTTYFATPGYGIVDLSAWWEPEQLNGLKINAGIFNVFDKTYYDYSSVRTGGTQPSEFYSEPGRSFKISLTQRF
ncbi:TonB-dependent hemoglobin/transferrin/lactoferrin family receptor [Aquamicrobium terrae]|uniref:Hemoglobin/transferrin/lactoferrin receptor protein n=1 Tax=Aquamicrobium terrae TaxID=1324945 RepID=A0ABV2MYF8_9HYPH